MRHGRAIIAAVALIAGCDGAIAPPAPCDFDCALERNLAASRTHDADAFAETITRGNDIQLVEPYGPVRHGRAAYLEALRSFVGRGGYIFDYDIVDRRVGDELGYALLDVTMRFDDSQQTFRYYQLLIFALEDGEWRVVHDQITAADSIEGAVEMPDVEDGDG